MMTVDRRGFVASAATALLPGMAPIPVTRQIPHEEVDGGSWYSIPGFNKIVDDRTYLPTPVCGWRPERKINGVSTVRLESEPQTGRPLVIHNYGHCGSGVTLGLGCASLTEQWLAKIAQKSKDAAIMIVGAGVIGLSMAYVLKSRGYKNVSIRARVVSSGSFDKARTVSDIAGGQFDAAGVSAIGGNIIPQLKLENRPLNAVLSETLGTLTARRGLANDQFTVRGSSSLYIYTVVRNYTTNPIEIPPALNVANTLVLGNKALNDSIVERYGAVLPDGGEAGVIAPFLELQKSRLTNDPIMFGVRDTVLINTSNLLFNILAYLKTSVDGPPVAVISGPEVTVNSHDELRAIDADVVINCTGLGGAVIGGEGREVNMTGVYGLLARLERLDAGYGRNERRYLYSGLGYMFPRSDGTIVGGAWDDRTAKAKTVMSAADIASLASAQQAEYFSSLRDPDLEDRERARDMVWTVGSFFLGRRIRLTNLRPVVEPWLSGARHFDCALDRTACPPRAAPPT